MKKYFFAFMFLFMLAFAMFGCTKDEPVEINLAIDLSEVNIKVGETATVVATITGTDVEPTWESADASIATVVNGVITGVGEGKTVVTVTVGSKTLSVSVTVKLEKFKVVFYDDEGNNLSSTTVVKGTSATEPAHPNKAGYMFAGWDTDFSNVTSDLVVTAIYRKYYNVSFELDGGTLIGESEGIRFADEDYVIPLACKVGTVFLGWTEEGSSSTTYLKTISKSVEGDVKLVAHYQTATKFDVTYAFDGGASESLYLGHTEEAVSTIAITAYNSSPKSYWGGGYANYIYLTEKSSDPGATFSDRIYIGKNSETGFYEIVSILTAGSSSWPSGAQYVLSISNSYESFNSVHNRSVDQLRVGMTVVFDTANFKSTISNKTPINAYFFEGVPQNDEVKTSLVATAKLETPVRLGFDFVGWFDETGAQKTSGNQLYGNIKLTARWEEKNPVTALNTNDLVDEMVTGETFKIDATVSPSDAYFKTVFFTSSNEDIIVVDETGRLTAKNAGKATITINDFMKKFTITQEITVYQIDSIDIVFDDSYRGVLAVGETLQLSPKALGKDVSSIKFSYRSTDVNVLTVSETGLVIAKANGVASIIITDSASTSHTLEIGVTVDALSTADKIDKVLKLIADNNFAVVDTGNVCLYNDGKYRVYDPTTGSVNRYLFDAFTINTDYVAQAREKAGHTDRRSTDQIEFVCVHDTATLSGTVQGIASYMSSGDVSIHYTVGNDLIYQVVPEDLIAWHAGDGTSAVFKWTNSGVTASANVRPECDITTVGNKNYLVVNGQTTSIEVPNINGNTPTKAHLTSLGPTWKVVDNQYYIGTLWASSSYNSISSHGGNNNSIGIEMCVNESGDIYDTWQRTAKLVADILIRHNLDTTRVKQHNTFSGKNCPQCLLAGNYWNTFMEMVELEYILQTQYPDVQISMRSNNPAIVDNTGRVVNAPSVTTTVSYTVTVTANGQSKSITLSSVIPGTTTWEQWAGTYSVTRIWNDGQYGLERKK